MKNIYKITKGQLMTIWLFAMPTVILLILRFANWCDLDEVSCKNGGSILPIIFIVFFLIFYTIGWKNNRNLN